MKTQPHFDQPSDPTLPEATRPILKFPPNARQASARRKGTDSGRSKVVPHPHAVLAPFRNPLEVAMLQSVVMTDCTIEATLQAGPSKHEGQEICVIFGYQDGYNYYYVHLGNMAAGHVNHLYRVQNGEPQPVPVKFSINTTWQPQSEHRLRVERSVRSGYIRVYFDDLTTPVLEAIDTSFTQGQAGLGTFGSDLQLSNVQVKGVRVRTDARLKIAR